MSRLGAMLIDRATRDPKGLRVVPIRTRDKQSAILSSRMDHMFGSLSLMEELDLVERGMNVRVNHFLFVSFQLVITSYQGFQNPETNLKLFRLQKSSALSMVSNVKST